MRLRELFALVIIIPSVVVWLWVSITATLRGSVSHCPRCGSGRIRRSMRRSFDRFFPMFICPFRCENCTGRYYALVSMSYVPARRRAVPRPRPVPQPSTRLARS